MTNKGNFVQDQAIINHLFQVLFRRWKQQVLIDFDMRLIMRLTWLCWLKADKVQLATRLNSSQT